MAEEFKFHRDGPDGLEASHRQGRPTFGPPDAWCQRCKEDWPCTTAELFEERHRLAREVAQLTEEKRLAVEALTSLFARFNDTGRESSADDLADVLDEMTGWCGPWRSIPALAAKAAPTTQPPQGAREGE